MTRLDVRRLDAADDDLAGIAAALNAAESELSSPTFTEETLRAFLSDDDRFYLVAHVDGALAGAAHGYLLLHPAGPRYVYVDEVDTFVPHRRRGVATALMREALAVARDLGAGELWLGTEEDNEPAKALYRSLGPSEEEPGPIFTFRVPS